MKNEGFEIEEGARQSGVAARTCDWERASDDAVDAQLIQLLRVEAE